MSDLTAKYRRAAEHYRQAAAHYDQAAHHLERDEEDAARADAAEGHMHVREAFATLNPTANQPAKRRVSKVQRAYAMRCTQTAGMPIRLPSGSAR